MTPHIQRFRHRPDLDEVGDCFRTCIACLLDLPIEDVPHFREAALAETDEVQRELMNGWLAGRGLRLINIAYDCTLDQLLAMMAASAPGLHYLVSGESRSGNNHIVIARDRMIVHDTSIEQVGIIGPCDTGQYLVSLLVANI